MAIHTIDSIKINGSSKFCGAFIYNLSYTPNFAESPSTMSLSLISEDSTYILPEKTTLKPYNIQIGTRISKNMYCISHSLRKSSGGKLLDVSFIDGSFVLDKTYVGLHKRHGINSQYATQQTWNFSGITNSNLLNDSQYVLTASLNDSLIVVGRELHPCDFNKNGVLDVNDIRAMNDPCSPCLDGKYEDNPCMTASFLQVLEVAYNFNDLIQKMGEVGINIQNIPTTNNYYLTQYTGPLRSVLKSWGADYGFSFYWEDDKLCFIDIKSEINIDFAIPADAKESEENETLEGTVSKGAISYIQKNGELKSYTCLGDENVTLKCIKLDDIKTNEGMKKVVYPSPDNTSELYAFETASILNYYDPVFRDAYWLYNVYSIASPTTARNKKGKCLAAFGDFVILDVYDENTNSTQYTIIKSLMKSEDLQAYADLETKYGCKLYFVLAFQSREKLLTFNKFEQEFAERFMGIYWYGEHNPPFGNAEEENYTVVDGQIELIKRGTDPAKLPFYQFGIDKGTALYELITSVGSSVPVKEIGRNGMAYRQRAGQSLQKNILLLMKNPAWYPEAASSASWSETVNKWNSRTIKRLNGVDYDTYLNGWVANADKTKLPTNDTSMISIFCLVEGQGPSVSATSLVKNPAEKKSNLCYRNSYEYGLRNDLCMSIKFDGLEMFTPVQSAIDTNDDGYKVIASQQMGVLVYIPKHQSVYQSDTSSSDDVLSFDINHRQIEDTDLSVLGISQCGISNSAAEAAHRLFNKNITYSNTNPTKTKSFTLPYLDLPVDIGVSIDNGLIKLDISATDQGITSRYAYSSRPAAPVSFNVAYREAESRVIRGIVP